MSENEKKKKVISVGDFIKSRDRIVDVAVPDPEEIGGTISIRLLIKKPSPADTIRIMEFVNKRLGDKVHLLSQEMSDMDQDTRNEAISLAYEYDATLISSSVYYPPDGDDLSIDTGKVFETSADVMDKCPNDLFNSLRMIVGQNRYVITEGEAKK